MKNILSEITKEEKNRILEMHKKSTEKFYLSEDIDPKTADSIKELNDFISKFKNKTISLYLPGDFSLPIISQFTISNISFGENNNAITINGSTSEIGDIVLFYRCDGTNMFNVDIQKFRNGFLNDIANLVDFGVDDNWKKLLIKYSNIKRRTMKSTKKDFRDIYGDLLRSNDRPIVEGGTDANGKDMISYIQDYICSINKKGNAVPKADFSSNNTNNQNMG
jgi:hypothetical protein